MTKILKKRELVPNIKQIVLYLALQNGLMAQELLQQPATVLQSVFGYSTFRPLQEEAIDHILEGGDTLVIMPTGGGKSLCYQIPALLLPGITVVISPLIALMKDQVAALNANGIAAAAINSSLDPGERRDVHEAIHSGKLKLLYVSPEKALSAGFGQYLASLQVSLLAVDEAHCVSMWGNDFRPEYARLYTLFEYIPHTPILALTATADPATQADIMDKLKLRNPRRFLGSFERTNLYLDVQPAQDRYVHLQRFIREQQGQAGIMYCLSRNSTVELAERLAKNGIKAAAYHAGLERMERDRVQEAFQKDELQVVCATIAFGMGIDKSNIRWIIHYNLPKNIESYYQEIGRAGRDGAPAQTLLFAGFGDVMSYRSMIEKGDAPEEFKAVQHLKLDRMFDFSQARSCRTNFILGYFGESKGDPCGHCDNCKNPPSTIDGTEIAQKALSALKRTNEQVGIQLLTDILRGSMQQDIRNAGYDRIRTFGTGKDISRNHWLQYITQLINQGILAIDYTAHSKLKVSALGEEVLFSHRKVALVRPVEFEARARPVRLQTEKPKDIFHRELLALLHAWRKKQADAEGINPSHLFSDLTLLELVDKQVLVKKQLEHISGFSKHKVERYGSPILQVIRMYFLEQQHVRTIKGGTYIQTLAAIQKGQNLESVARDRNVTISTVYNHLLWLYGQEEPIDLERYLEMDDCLTWIKAWEAMGRPEFLSQLMERFQEQPDYNKLRLAIAWYQRQPELFKDGVT